MLIFDHIGIVVADLDAASEQIRRLLPIDGSTRRFDDEGLGVSVQFFRDRSGLVFELIAPLGERSPVANTLAQQHRLNQIAYRCVDLETEVKVLRRAGAMPLGRPAPAIAFGGARVSFLWSPLGHVIELIEAPEFHHAFTSLGG